MTCDAAAAASGGTGQASIQVVVIGDAGTGKSTLIEAIATESFVAEVPHLLPPVHLPSNSYRYSVPITVVDTSSRPEYEEKLIAECKAADIIILTYACNCRPTLDRLCTYWIPELRRLEVKVPMLVVGCKLDLRDDRLHVPLDQVMEPIMHQFREIQTCIECSALRQIQIPEVLDYAQKAVFHPTAPLFDQETDTLKPRCARALKRIFIFFDHDRDGVLNDAELNNFQVTCFNAALQSSEIMSVKRVIQDKIPEGVDDCGLTLIGFICLHVLFIERGSLETIWAVLRKFGYDNYLKLRDELLSTTLNLTPDQTVELSVEALDFLKEIFHMFDTNSDGVLDLYDIDELFSTTPENPWSEHPYKNTAEKIGFEGYSLEGFISQWAFMTLQDPKASLANLMYLGYTGDFASAFHITRKRRLDRKKKQTRRNVFQCFVFGPKNAGKTALLKSFIGRKFSEKYSPTKSFRFATNVVDLRNGTKRTLVMREVPEQEVKNLLSNKESLAACDIAAFVYDSSDENNWKKARELLEQVASHGENTGFEVPCLVIAAKDDLDPYSLSVEDSTRVAFQMGIESPIPVSMKLRDHNVFYRIVNAAQLPHLSIPQTEDGKSRKQYLRFINQSLVFVSVGAAVAVAGLAAFRIYAARKNSSG
ncbi:mitochondrial Rho GTPase 1-like isoform X1 [Zingiber officinale]|uniref:mitochondrial Rho GTPase 1-like isoform X1 n=1 Tax=Zingiber officinale TaxID=94328 RepID=UPI001C4BA754|nr:mitochondrial Rho GTPase 1-like isoform X1 [Zingiber officinale]